MDDPRGVVTRSQARKLLQDMHKGLKILGVPSPCVVEAITMLTRQEEADFKGISPPIEPKLGTHVNELITSQCAPDDTVKVTKGPAMTPSDTPVGVRSAPGACQGEGHGRF